MRMNTNRLISWQYAESLYLTESLLLHILCTVLCITNFFSFHHNHSLFVISNGNSCAFVDNFNGLANYPSKMIKYHKKY